MSKAVESKEIDIWKDAGSKDLTVAEITEQEYREKLAAYFRNMSAAYKAKDDLINEHKCLLAAKNIMEVETDFLTPRDLIKEKIKS